MSRNDKEGMSKRREKTIRLNRFGNTLTYDGANGKTVGNISVSHGDHTLYVYITFTDDTEVAVHFNTLPMADVTLCGDVHGDLELIARSGPTVLPELGYIHWDQIQQPPKGQSSRNEPNKRVAESADNPLRPIPDMAAVQLTVDL